MFVSGWTGSSQQVHQWSDFSQFDIFLLKVSMFVSDLLALIRMVGGDNFLSLVCFIKDLLASICVFC